MDTTTNIGDTKQENVDFSTDDYCNNLDNKDDVTENNVPEEKDIFVQSSIEKAMNVYWPEPATDYHCRICNYLEFDNDESLKQHKETEDHKFREGNEALVFCLICQIHNYNEEMMVSHQNNERHVKLSKIFSKAKFDAEEIWEARNNKQLLSKDKRSILGFEGSTQMDNLTINYNCFNAQFKDDIIHLKRKLKDFYDANYYCCGTTDVIFNDVAVKMCMDEYYPANNVKRYCMACNFVKFKSAASKRKHNQTKLHLDYVAAMKYFFCRICKRNHLSEKAFKKHLSLTVHKQLACLLYVCKIEVKFLSAARKTPAYNYEFLKDIIYPKDGFMQDEKFCKVCAKEIGETALGHSKGNKKHATNFRRLISRLNKRDYAYEDGCAVCQLSKAEHPDYNRMVHVKSNKHQENRALFESGLGLTNEQKIRRSKQKMVASDIAADSINAKEISSHDIIRDGHEMVSQSVNNPLEVLNKSPLKSILKKRSHDNVDQQQDAKRLKEEEFEEASRIKTSTDQFGSVKPGHSLDLFY